MTALPQTPPTPLGPILKEALAKLLPDELSPETFNSQYLQRHSTSAAAVLACAKVLVKLQVPREQVEETVFGLLSADVKFDNIKVSTAIPQLDGGQFSDKVPENLDCFRGCFFPGEYRFDTERRVPEWM